MSENKKSSTKVEVSRTKFSLNKLSDKNKFILELLLTLLVAFLVLYPLILYGKQFLI